MNYAYKEATDMVNMYAYNAALKEATDMLNMFETLEPRSALKEAASMNGIECGNEMGNFVMWAENKLYGSNEINIFADTAEEASAIYSKMRDESYEGASTWPDGDWNGYRISYNGKVWDGEEVLYSPFA